MDVISAPEPRVSVFVLMLTACDIFRRPGTALALAALLNAGIAQAAPIAQPEWNSLSNQAVCSPITSNEVSPDAWLARTADAAALRPGNYASLDTSFQLVHMHEQHNAVPLPAGEWTGLTCLLGLALVRARKAIGRMFM